MVKLMSDGGRTFDIEIRENLFQANKAAKEEFNNKFKSALTKMQSVYNELEATKGFKGKAKEGFMETFEILLLFHNDLIKNLPDLYKSIDTLKSDFGSFEKRYDLHKFKVKGEERWN